MSLATSARLEYSADEAVRRALEAVRELEIPHLEWGDEGGQVVH